MENFTTKELQDELSKRYNKELLERNQKLRLECEKLIEENKEFLSDEKIPFQDSLLHACKENLLIRIMSKKIEKERVEKLTPKERYEEEMTYKFFKTPDFKKIQKMYNDDFYDYTPLYKKDAPGYYKEFHEYLKKKFNDSRLSLELIDQYTEIGNF